MAGHCSRAENPFLLTSGSEDEFDQLLFGKRSKPNGFSPLEPNRSSSEVVDKVEFASDDDFLEEQVRMMLKNLLFLIINSFGIIHSTLKSVL